MSTRQPMEMEMPRVLLPDGNAGLSNLLESRFGLTPRESRIALILTEGLSYEEIARRLSISPHTVHTHVKAIHRKLWVHSSARAAALIRDLERE